MAKIILLALLIVSMVSAIVQADERSDCIADAIKNTGLADKTQCQKFMDCCKSRCGQNAETACKMTEDKIVTTMEDTVCKCKGGSGAASTRTNFFAVSVFVVAGAFVYKIFN